MNQEGRESIQVAIDNIGDHPGVLSTHFLFLLFKPSISILSSTLVALYTWLLLGYILHVEYSVLQLLEFSGLLKPS